MYALDAWFSDLRWVKANAKLNVNLGSTRAPIDNLIRLADKMTTKSDGIACELYAIILDKMTTIDGTELSRCELQHSFGKFLVKIKDYEQANRILEEALQYAEQKNVSYFV